MIQEYLTNNCKSLSMHCTLVFITQSEPLGLSHALSLAREFTAGQPFAVFLPDDMTAGPQLPLAQILDVFETMGGAVFALAVAPPGVTAHWSDRWQLKKVDNRIYRVQPSQGGATPNKNINNFAGLGRYVFSAQCLEFAALLMNESQGGELDDGMLFKFMHAIDKPVSAVVIEGSRFDISTTDGYIAAWRHFGKSTPIEKYLAV